MKTATLCAALTFSLLQTSDAWSQAADAIRDVPSSRYSTQVVATPERPLQREIIVTDHLVQKLYIYRLSFVIKGNGSAPRVQLLTTIDLRKAGEDQLDVIGHRWDWTGDFERLLEQQQQQPATTAPSTSSPE